MNPTFASFKQQRHHDCGLKNITNIIPKMQPKTFQQIKNIKQRADHNVSDVDNTKNIKNIYNDQNYLQQQHPQQSSIMSNANYILKNVPSLLKKSNSQVGLEVDRKSCMKSSKQTCQPGSKLINQCNTADKNNKNAKRQPFNIIQQNYPKIHRPNILGPSIIKNKSYITDSYKKPPYQRHRHRPSDLGARMEKTGQHNEKDGSSTKKSAIFTVQQGRVLNFENCQSITSIELEQYSDGFSRSISNSAQESSFADDSSKDYSCFNTSGLNESILDSFASVNDKSLPKFSLNLSSRNSSNITDSPQSSISNSQKAQDFGECSFGNPSTHNNSAIISNTIASNNHTKGSLRNSVNLCDSHNESSKKESSINFTKKFKFYRQNTLKNTNQMGSSVVSSLTSSIKKPARTQPVVAAPTKLSIDQFVLLKQLGEGKYGKVYLAQHKITNFIFAMKTISITQIINQNLQQTFIDQLKIQLYLKHPNIVKLYAFFKDEQNFYLLMEYCQDGHLLTAIKNKQVEESTTHDILANVFDAVSYIHCQGVIHRDLKPENIVIHQGLYKICDFGWAAYARGDTRTTFCGTPLYVSPEVLKGQQYDAKTDIWGLGILAYELAYGRVPFPIWNQTDMIKIVKDPVYYPAWANITPQLLQLIQTMLNKDPCKRPTLNQILTSSVIKKIKKIPANMQNQFDKLF